MLHFSISKDFLFTNSTLLLLIKERLQDLQPPKFKFGPKTVSLSNKGLKFLNFALNFLVNDEAPILFSPPAVQYVAEDARGGTPIMTIEAKDPDRDQIKYRFHTASGQISLQDQYFEIDEDTGWY